VAHVSKRQSLLSAAACASAVLLTMAPAAVADPVGDAVTNLRSARVYVDPDAGANGVKVDLAAASAAVPADARVAVLADTTGRDITLANSIEGQLVAQLGTPLTVGVILVAPTGTVTFRAASSKFCPGFADKQAAQAATAHASDLQKGIDLTPTVVEFAHRLTGGPVDNGHCPNAAAGSSRSGGWAVWVWITGIAIVLGAAAAAAMYLRAGRRTRGSSDAERTDDSTDAERTDDGGTDDGGTDDGGTDDGGTDGDPVFGGILTGNADDDEPGSG
jgi:hypothetical protein